MEKIKNLFTVSFLLAVIVVIGGLLWFFVPATNNDGNSYEYETNKYGAFLAAQHAIYVNDFEKATEFSAHLSDKEISMVQNTIILSDFLSGKMPADAADLKDEKSAAAGLIYDAYLVQNGDWKTLYNRHKSDDSALTASLRIWSSVANDKTSDALKFIDTLKTNDSWKSFIRGQIYAETDKPDTAAKHFEKVSTDFMNINDYLYLIAFYQHNNMEEAAQKLRTDFTRRPGGMYMLDIKKSPKWANYSGHNNALGFSLIQAVSHTQVMMYSDLSLLLLRFAEIVQCDTNDEKDAINYYIGQYFFNNGGEYKKHFDKIDKDSPYYPFVMMKIAEKTGKLDNLEDSVRANPLFVPAVNKLIARYVQKGEKKKALRIIDQALENKNLTETGRAFFLKTRANVNLTFGHMEEAQSDIRAAADILPVDAGILALQSKIWSTQKRELETAYEYAIALVRKNPTDVESWDVLGMAVWAKEGPKAALEIIERVGQVSESCSVLFEHLGDLYVEIGNKKLARDAYLRAIDLSEDGLIILPKLEKKIRNLK